MSDSEMTPDIATELANPREEQSSSGAQESRQSTQQRSGRQRGPSIPTVDELLMQLLQLNGAVVMGAMSTKDAALINRNIKAVLDVQLRRKSRDDAPLEQDALVDRCRRDPSLLSVVSSFLSPQQVEELMREVMDDDDEPA